jgi:hypothetical protein
MYKLGEITMYSPDDVCKAFHIGKAKCLKIFKMKELHAVRIGNKLLVSEANLMSLMNSGKIL